jgi:hypothetical protein
MIVFLDIIQSPVFYLKHMFRRIVTSSIDWIQLSMFHLKTETESNFRNVVCFQEKQDDGLCPETQLYSSALIERLILLDDFRGRLQVNKRSSKL